MKKAKLPQAKTRSKTISRKANHKKRSGFNGARFLPAILIAALAVFLWLQPSLSIKSSGLEGVLAYATNTSHEGLLSATNSQRSANAVGTLSLNAKLNSAAQAKANDMVSRNYWSHQTPDGAQPWVFITNAGYQYSSAGENLAYGFSNSSGTVTGWMNSPSHKANLLSSKYTEVGFGMANSPNYVNSGQQTVVVAMYASPQATKESVQSEQVNSAPAAPNTSARKPTTPQPVAQNPTPAPAPEVKPEEPVAEPASQEGEQTIQPANYSTDNTLGSSEESKGIQRIHLLTGGEAAWSATLVVLLVCSAGALWAVHRGYRLSQIIRKTSKVIGKNLHIDLAILSMIFLGYILLSTSGVIR